MDIAWYGLSCFRIRENGTTIICDPFDQSVGIKLPKLSAHIITVSHDQPGHGHVKAVEGDAKVLSGPGEYEMQNVFITGMATYHRQRGDKAPERNVAYFFDFGDLIVAHLGDMGEVPKQSEIDELQAGDVDILLLPVGGGDALDPTRAVEVVGMFEPKLVIPMHYQQEDAKAAWIQELEPVDKFLKELGIMVPDSEKMLRVTKTGLPEETQVVLLTPS